MPALPSAWAEPMAPTQPGGTAGARDNGGRAPETHGTQQQRALSLSAGKCIHGASENGKERETERGGSAAALRGCKEPTIHGCYQCSFLRKCSDQEGANLPAMYSDIYTHIYTRRCIYTHIYMCAHPHPGAEGNAVLAQCSQPCCPQARSCRPPESKAALTAGPACP